MFKRTLAIMLSGLILSSAFGFARARAQGADASAEKARAAVQKLGVGPQSRVEVRLEDGTRLKGSLSAAGDDTFAVTDSKTGASRTVAYADVAKVKRPGGGLSTRSWVIIGAAAVAAIIIGKEVIYPVLCDGGAGC